jgi:hypothetical protein
MDLEVNGRDLIKVLSQNSLGSTDKDQKDTSHGRDSNRAPPEYECRALPLRKPAHYVLVRIYEYQSSEARWYQKVRLLGWECMWPLCYRSHRLCAESAYCGISFGRLLRSAKAVSLSIRVVGWGTMLQAAKAAGSIPDEVIVFLSWPNPSSRTMALGSTQSPTEMSTRNLPGGKGRPAHKADLTAICEPIV